MVFGFLLSSFSLNHLLLIFMVAALNGGHVSCSLCCLAFYQIQSWSLQFLQYGMHVSFPSIYMHLNFLDRSGFLMKCHSNDQPYYHYITFHHTLRARGRRKVCPALTSSNISCSCSLRLYLALRKKTNTKKNDFLMFVVLGFQMS